MRNFWSVAFAVAWRVLHNVFTTPSLFLPGMIFPLFFFTAFAGGLSRVSNIPGFDFPNGYTAFQFVFVLLQSAAFGGVFTGFGIARDFEYGFARRLLIANPAAVAVVWTSEGADDFLAALTYSRVTMEELTLELYSTASNCAVVRPPGRRFPGIVLALTTPWRRRP
jgi:hypothetical protein